MKKRLIQVIAILGGVCILSLGGLALGNKISNKHNKEMVKVEEVNVVDGKKEDDNKVNDENKTNINNDTSNGEAEKENSKVVEKNNNTSNDKEGKEGNKVTEKNNDTSNDGGEKESNKVVDKNNDHKKDNISIMKKEIRDIMLKAYKQDIKDNIEYVEQVHVGSGKRIPKELVNTDLYRFRITKGWSQEETYYYDYANKNLFVSTLRNVELVNDNFRDIIAERYGKVNIGKEKAQELMNKYIKPELSQGEEAAIEDKELLPLGIGGGGMYSGDEYVDAATKFYKVNVVKDNKTEVEYLISSYDGSVYREIDGKKLN